MNSHTSGLALAPERRVRSVALKRATRLVAILIVLSLGAACASRDYRAEEFASRPGFVPSERHVRAANEFFPIVEEGSGRLVSGERFFLIAYQVPDALSRRTWFEIQAIWEQARDELDPSEFDLAIIEARLPRARWTATDPIAAQAVFESQGAFWEVYSSDATFVGRPGD